MSIALALEKDGELILAADTLTSFGHTKVPPVLHAAQKVRRVGASWLAATGWGLYENILDDVLARRKNVRLGSREQISTSSCASGGTCTRSTPSSTTRSTRRRPGPSATSTRPSSSPGPRGSSTSGRT
jgi:hypothetical protein